MKQDVHSVASYLSKPKASYRTYGHFFLSGNSSVPHNNGAVLNIAHLIKHIMSSAPDAKLAARYMVAQEAIYIHIIVQELGHNQPPTLLQTDNSMTAGVENGKVQP